MDFARKINIRCQVQSSPGTSLLGVNKDICVFRICTFCQRNHPFLNLDRRIRWVPMVRGIPYSAFYVSFQYGRKEITALDQGLMGKWDGFGSWGSKLSSNPLQHNTLQQNPQQHAVFACPAFYRISFVGICRSTGITLMAVIFKHCLILIHTC